MTGTPSRSDDILVTFAWNDAIEELYGSWRRDAATAEHAHRVAGERSGTRHAIVGSLLVLASVVAAAGALVLLAEGPRSVAATAGLGRDAVLIVVASAASASAVLTVAAMILRDPARAEAHRIAALRYASLVREIDATLAMPREVRRDPDGALVEARERIDRYAKGSRPIGRWLRRTLEREASGSMPSSPAPADGLQLPEAAGTTGMSRSTLA